MPRVQLISPWWTDYTPLPLVLLVASFLLYALVPQFKNDRPGPRTYPASLLHYPFLTNLSTALAERIPFHRSKAFFSPAKCSSNLVLSFQQAPVLWWCPPILPPQLCFSQPTSIAQNYIYPLRGIGNCFFHAPFVPFSGPPPPSHDDHLFFRSKILPITPFFFPVERACTVSDNCSPFPNLPLTTYGPENTSTHGLPLISPHTPFSQPTHSFVDPLPIDNPQFYIRTQPFFKTSCITDGLFGDRFYDSRSNLSTDPLICCLHCFLLFFIFFFLLPPFCVV